MNLRGCKCRARASQSDLCTIIDVGHHMHSDALLHVRIRLICQKDPLKPLTFQQLVSSDDNAIPAIYHGSVVCIAEIFVDR